MRKFINSRDGKVLIIGLLWLLSLVLMAEYAIRQTVKVYDMTAIRMIGSAQTSCEQAESAFVEEREAYEALEKKTQEYIELRECRGI